MNFQYGLIITMALLVSASLALIYNQPDDIPKSKSLEQYANEIAQINDKSKKYYLIDDVQKFNASKKLMQETLKEISLNYMGLEIGHVELIEGYYPFQNATFWEKRFDLEPLSVCDFERKIPLHMKIVSQTENFKMFTKKYAPYKLVLSIQDERTYQSNVHYGLIATNDGNQRASTYFHINSCTGEITDKEPYFLHCFDETSDYRFATFNSNDIISSYSNDHFCKIELDPWRQSLHDYSKTMQQKQRQLEREAMEGTIDAESQQKFFSEMNKQGDLGNLVAYMIHYDFDEQSLQEKIEQYEQQYDSLPEELLELMEKEKPKPSQWDFRTLPSYVFIPNGAANPDNEHHLIPKDITVFLGKNNTVTWINEDDTPSTLVADDGTWSTGQMSFGDTASVTFNETGVYHYHGSPHPWKTGSITVKD